MTTVRVWGVDAYQALGFIGTDSAHTKKPGHQCDCDGASRAWGRCHRIDTPTVAATINAGIAGISHFGTPKNINFDTKKIATRRRRPNPVLLSEEDDNPDNEAQCESGR
jgi:hypothetical protein